MTPGSSSHRSDGRGPAAPETGQAAPRAARWRRACQHLRAAGPGIAVIVAFGHALYSGWGRYGSILLDTGRELELPRRMLEGAALYSDLRWYYGPLAPWVNAALYRLFGPHLDVLATAGAVSAALLALVLHRLARQFCGRLLSAAVVIAFVYLCAFRTLDQAAIFNFVLPYTFAATYGMLAAATSLLFLVRHARSGLLPDLGVSLALASLAALAKVEVLAPTLAAHATFVVAAAWEGRLRRAHLLAYGGAAALVASVYGGLLAYVGPALWTENLTALGNARSRIYIAKTMGYDELADALLSAAASLGLFVGVLGLAFIGASLARRGRAAQRAGLAVAAGCAFAVYGTFGVHLGFRILPLLLLGALAAGGVAFIQRPERRGEIVPELLLHAFAFAALARIALRAGPENYGFFLLPVPLVALAVLAARQLPRARPVLRHSLTAATVGLLLGASGDAFTRSFAWYEQCTTTFSGPRGTIRGPWTNDFALPLYERLRALPPASCVMVIPQGATLPFVAGLRSCDEWSSYLPMELATPEAEVRLVASWLRTPPDLVILIRGELPDLGTKGFGLDYAQGAAAWLQRTHRIVETIGPAILAERTEGGLGVTSVPASE